MKILVINTGSSSIKYELININNQQVLSSGIAEKIGEKSSILTHRVILANGQSAEKKEKEIISDHKKGMERIVDLLCDKEYGAIKNKSEIDAVGHRVVHGGETFQSSTIIDQDVIDALKENIPLAPLHNPANLTGIKVAETIFPNAKHIGVFDTAFHQTLPKKSYLYALPNELYEKNKIRRYGFHGTSHAYVAERAAEYLKRPLTELNLITIHIGNGASITAIKNGKSVDTSMGLTPLAGLMMGTRCGNIDPAIPLFMATQLGMTLKEIDAVMNKKSGLKGICGTNDMREVEQKKDSGDKQAEIALEMYTYKIKKYIGSYFAVLGNVDAIVFTAGIGENSPFVREKSCEGLSNLGIKLDLDKNNNLQKGSFEISTSKSKVKVLVIPTNEELKIALETQRVINAMKQK